MKEEIKNLRVRIDGLSQLVEGLRPIMNIHVRDGKKTNTKEIEKAYDSLILAKAWLGKVLGELGELGESTPYANDGNRKTVEDIEPTADKAGKSTIIANSSSIATGENRGKSFESFSHIEKVDWLRTEIEILVKQIKQIGNPLNPHMLNREASIARTNSYSHLCEARFWLGFELQRVKENK